MTNFFSDNSLSIGNTPLVKINKMAQGLKATILAKIEGRNPAYSVKCPDRSQYDLDGGKTRPDQTRHGDHRADQRQYRHCPGFVGAARGYQLDVTMPETMSMERRQLLALFGANIILTPGAKGMKGAIEEAERIAASSR